MEQKDNYPMNKTLKNLSQNWLVVHAYEAPRVGFLVVIT